MPKIQFKPARDFPGYEDWKPDEIREVSDQVARELTETYPDIFVFAEGKKPEPPKAAPLAEASDKAEHAGADKSETGKDKKK